jgi:AmpE protein
MVFMSVLIVVIVQYWLHLSNAALPKTWFVEAFRCLYSHTQSPNAGNGFSGALQVILVPVLITAVVFWIAQAIFGRFGYFVLGVAWLWYLMDVTSVHQKHTEAGRVLWTQTYRHIFSKIFWFALFGPVGMALQYFSALTYDELSQDDTHSQTRAAAGRILAVLDWVPARLLGLTYALVGHFSATFMLCQESLTSGLSDAAELVARFGEKTQEDQSHVAVSATVMRALWVWLVVLALVSIGMLL